MSKNKTRIIGIDYGQKRVGISASDETHMLATPIGTFTTSKKLPEKAQEIAGILRKHQEDFRYDIQEIVIGKPLHMNGSQSDMATEAEAFGSLLKEILLCPIKYWDERLSSLQVERLMIEAGVSRKKRTLHVDKLAAQLILQNYLDAQK